MWIMDSGTRLFNSTISSAMLLALVFSLSATTGIARADDSKEPARVANRTTTDNGEKAHPLVPAIKIAKSSAEAARQLKDFEANFSKREVIGRRVHAHTMHIKLRTEPFSVYLRFHKPHEGREVIYVEGQNQGQLLAHETGLKGIVGTVALDPLSREALSESKHPITQIGMANLVEAIIEQWEEETKYGEIDVKYYPQAKLGEMECKVVEASHPQPRRQFPFHKTRLFIDKKTNLPVRVEQYGFPPRSGANPPLLEEYTYSNIRTNVGLGDIDFDTRNPRYGF